ncbi:MAG TPA: PilZ domain-containing protein, partial [Anaeromyxobacteraceae bacterium]|nr:PilZ domain-containing protein [Anaeromyxobacteraceae bacterium]
SLPAAHFLAMAARGEPVAFRDRAPRFAAERRLVLVHHATSVDARTLNVSEGGTAVRWTGPLPAVGDLVSIRLGEGLFFPRVARAVVCWTQPGGSVDRSVGLRVIPEGRAARAWRGFVAEIARSGAAAA